MSDDDGSDPQTFQDDCELFSHFVSQERVKGSQRLIEKEYARPNGQCAGKSDALPLSARKCLDRTIGVGLKIDEFEHSCDRFFDFLRIFFAYCQAVCHIFSNRHVGKKGIGLEHETDLSFFGGNVGYVFSADPNLRAFIGSFQARNHAQQRCFAATGRSQQHGTAAGFHRERKGGKHQCLAIVLADVFEFDRDRLLSRIEVLIHISYQFLFVFERTAFAQAFRKFLHEREKRH